VIKARKANKINKIAKARSCLRVLIVYQEKGKLFSESQVLLLKIAQANQENYAIYGNGNNQSSY
jgi:hypothetical protein